MKFIKSNITKDNVKVSGYSSSTNSSSSASGGQASSLEPHKLWGQTFDGTKDISGDMTDVGKIIATDDISTQGDFIIKQLDTEGKEVEGGDLNISVDGTAAKFSGKETYEFDGEIKAPKGTIENLVSSTAAITTLATENITNADTIKTKNLEVTGSAHFFELVIDKIKAAGGAVLFTPSDGFEIDIVEKVTDGYKLYWQCQDGNGNQRDNMWKVNDQAICQSFNQAKVGTSHDVSNKYYWSLVTEVSDSANPILIDGEYYNYIVISTTTYDGTVNPSKGDAIAMLGYRGTDDEKRQSAIYISAYTSLDSGLTAPLMAQYKGINDFSLSSHRKTYWDAKGAKFVGDFEVSSGDSIENYIISQINNKQPYIGTDGYWYVWDKDKETYVKSDTKAQGTDGNQPYIGTDGYWYVWNATTESYVRTSTKASGTDGTDGHSPYIGNNGYWYAWNSSSQSYTSTGVKAEGIDGKDANQYPLIKVQSGGTNGGGCWWTVYQNGTQTFKAGSLLWSAQCVVFDMSDNMKQIGRINSYNQTEIANWIKASYTDAKYLIALSTDHCSSLESDLADLMYQYGCPTKLSTISYTTQGSWCFLGYHYGSNNTYEGGRGMFSYNPSGGTCVSAYVVNGKLFGVDTSSSYSLKTSIDGLTSTCTSIQNNMVTQSVLQQKADSILASVNDTFVKIGDGNITLNGDTKINGSLTLNSSDQGFILKGESGITEISPKEIGTYTNFKNKSSSVIYTNTSRNVASVTQSITSGYYEFSYSIGQSLGNFKS